jgi:hypothetical protein
MQRQELSNSPPFDQIARRNELTPEMLAYLILSPHPRMNMTLSREEVDDLAAYIVGGLRAIPDDGWARSATNQHQPPR